MIAGSQTRASLQRCADKTLVSDASGARTGEDINLAVDRLACKLLENVPAGGAVGLWSWNSAELLVAHLAAERAGLTRVPVDPEAPLQEVRAIMAKAGVEMMIVDEEHEGGWSPGRILLSDELWTGEDGGPCREVEVSQDDIALRVVRGVVNDELFAIPLSIANWEAHMDLATALFENDAYGAIRTNNPCFLTVQQMQYGTGLLGTFPFIRMGLPQHIVRKFDPRLVTDAVLTHGTNVTFMVPGMITRLADHIGATKPPGWKLQILYGGAPFPLPEMLPVMQSLGTSLTQLYGRFEGGWPLTILTSQDHAEIAGGNHALAKSCGRQAPGVQLDLRDLSGSGSTELRVRGKCVSEAFTDPDGWCALGDLATIDSSGYIYLAGRVDGMINTGSFHVYPGEVEDAIHQEFPALQNVTVSARPNQRWGQAVHAEMSWATQADIPAKADFRARMILRLAKYKVPTVWENKVDGHVVQPSEGNPI